MSTVGPTGTDRLRIPVPRVARPRRPATLQRTRSTLVPPASDLFASTFVAVDFETANRSGGVSACQVALVKVSEGEVVERHTTYINPPQGYDRFEFTWLHGISRAQTATAPRWDEIAEELDMFIEGVPVYAHNAAFDARVWRELDSHFGTITTPAKFYCSFRLAQRTVPGLANYKLPTVVQACIPDFRLNHHDAGSDAEACARIVAAIQGMPEVRSALA